MTWLATKQPSNQNKEIVTHCVNDKNSSDIPHVILCYLKIKQTFSEFEILSEDVDILFKTPELQLDLR